MHHIHHLVNVLKYYKLGALRSPKMSLTTVFCNTKELITHRGIFRALSVGVLAAGIVLGLFSLPSAARAEQLTGSQEVSESDGTPILLKHLPDWQAVRPNAVFIKSRDSMAAALGERAVLEPVEFTAGTEAVAAPYPEGKLFLVEYMTPQASTEADARFAQKIAENPDPNTHYRRIGNYSAFVFDAPDPAAAAALLDQIKYEKTVQWLGEDPFLYKKLERAFVTTTSEVFVSTVLAIILGMGSSILVGLIVGYIYFRFREHQRAHMSAFSDAGGMTRLNLDGLTPDILPERLLKD